MLQNGLILITWLEQTQISYCVLNSGLATILEVTVATSQAAEDVLGYFKQFISTSPFGPRTMDANQGYFAIVWIWGDQIKASVFSSSTGACLKDTLSLTSVGTTKYVPCIVLVVPSGEGPGAEQSLRGGRLLRGLRPQLQRHPAAAVQHRRSLAELPLVDQRRNFDRPRSIYF